MWTDYIQAPNLMMAEMWKDLLEGEGLPTRVAPAGPTIEGWGEEQPFRVMVPEGRQHVAEEILRKL